MEYLTYQHLIGVFITLLLVIAAGVYAGSKIKDASDFMSGGNKAKWHIITGTIIGTLVGGSSTLGTVQMAYVYGLSGWWFTLGAGIGCLVLALFFIGPFRETKANTISEILTMEYGSKIGLYSSIFISVGMFLNIVAQVLSFMALSSGTVNIEPILGAICGIFLMAIYVIFGGVWGAGIVGVLKTVILYIAMIASGIIAYINSRGFTGLAKTFPAYPWFSLFGRGFFKDIAAGFSLVVGVLSTQTYIQAVISGKNARESKIGTILSAIMIPPIGLAGVLIGLFMRKNYYDIDAAKAFPLFIVNHLNPWLGGILIGALFIAIIGTGAGLTLGISTVLTNDIYRNYTDKEADNKKLLLVSRIIIVATLCLSLVFVSGSLKSLILEWSFLSMGLRGTAAFVPMIAALFFKGRVSPKAATLSVIIGPIASIGSKICLPEIDPLYIGILTSVMVIFIFNRSKTSKKQTEMSNG